MSDSNGEGFIELEEIEIRAKAKNYNNQEEAEIILKSASIDILLRILENIEG